jgi:hypothetical protein
MLVFKFPGFCWVIAARGVPVAGQRAFGWVGLGGAGWGKKGGQGLSERRFLCGHLFWHVFDQGLVVCVLIFAGVRTAVQSRSAHGPSREIDMPIP